MIGEGITAINNTNKNFLTYLMAAYAYYVEDDPILEDNVFDKMAKRMLELWDEIEHPHKQYLNKDMLEAGTFVGEYPTRVKGGIDSVRETYK